MLDESELLAALTGGHADTELVAIRQRTRQDEARFRLPTVLDDAAIAALTAPPVPLPADAAAWTGLPLAGGQARGPVRIVTDPLAVSKLGQGYVLVCPSTDPAWTPLLLGAAGLVVERGGALSHGAIVARELGVPAVTLPNATRLLRDGELVTVNGSTGQLHRAQEAAAPAALPLPRTSPRERWGWQITGWLTGAWSLLLLARAFQPAWQPPLGQAMLDAVLWPLVRHLGEVGATAAIAGGLAVILGLLQRLGTDHARSLAVKAWLHQARRHSGSQDLAATGRAHWRLLAVSLFPVAVLLGPLVLIFLWLPARVAPAARSPQVPTTVNLVAEVDSDWRLPLTLTVGPELALDEGFSATVTLAPIRETLAALQAHWGRGETVNWAGVPPPTPENRAALAQFLAEPLPPQRFAWRLRPTDAVASRQVVKLRLLQIPVVFGRDYPPGPRRLVPSPAVGWPIYSVTVQYPRPAGRQVFWTPLAPFGWHWDLGWLGVYLLAYLPALWLTRRLLRLT